MIIEMPNTKTSAIARKVAELHEQRGEAGNDRVLTLIISTEESELECALEVANAVSREHPCRVIAVVPRSESGSVPGEAGSASEPTVEGVGVAGGTGVGAAVAANGTVESVFVGLNDKPECVSVDYPKDSASGVVDGTDLDAQVRFGADAGAGEVIILRPSAELMGHADTLVIPLLVPDIPVVTWWPTNPPTDPSSDPLGAMSVRRITDALRSDDPNATINALRANWSPKDIDLSWTRLTVWRAMLASMIDQPPHLPVTAVKVTGQANYLPLDMLASWLGLCFDVKVDVETSADADALTGVYFTREDGVVSLTRPNGAIGSISQPGQAPQPMSMPLRTLEDCLAEELRRTDPDEIYAQVVREG